ncbi:hypothetical protein FRAHR75_230037 [Frankia sp. Hr75.2]|nr:hypothetical protein FRAHR75_230037 [Frankia sp. Hr75.2]SQD97124.1 hypothetical protein FMEAI12_3940042 [Parafrankia sp. Ea1.12]
MTRARRSDTAGGHTAGLLPFSSEATPNNALTEPTAIPSQDDSQATHRGQTTESQPSITDKGH